MYREPINVLLIEDNPGDARLIKHMLCGPENQEPNFHLVWVDNLDDGAALLQSTRQDVVLLDLGLPGSIGLETLERLQTKVPALPALVVLSGFEDEQSALQAVQGGAQDYLIKGKSDRSIVVRSIRYARERSQAKDALQQAHAELERRVVERTAELRAAIDALNEQVRERMQAEELLRKSEQEFRTLAENLPDVVVRYKRNMARTYGNAAFRSMYEKGTGASAEEAIGKIPTADEWNRSMAAEDYLKKLEQVIATGEPAEILVAGAGVGGRTTYHAFHIVAERDPDGEITGALTIGREITALKEAERRLVETQHQLRALAAQREAVREEERKHLTREIHDELGQYLSAIRLGVSLIGLQFGDDNPVIKQKTGSVIESVDSTIRVVRDIVASLRPSVLDTGITSALEWLAEEFTIRTQVPCKIHIFDPRIKLQEQYAIGIFRIAQESLTNISRHASANRVVISLWRTEEDLIFEVKDDGDGFDPTVNKPKSFGLIGMRERAMMLDGQIELATAPGEGTVITVRLPAKSALK